MMGASAVAFCTLFTSCSNEEGATAEQYYQAVYDQKFVETFGQPNPNQDWGFSSSAQSRMTRSMEGPVCPDIVKPYDETWVATYCETAKEPNSTNVADNYDNSYYSRKEGTYVDPYFTWYSEFESLYPQADYGWDWNKAVAAAQAAGWEHWNDLFAYTSDETYVLNFKITGTWDGGIGVAASEGMQTPGCERTIVVTGTWNITENQRIGSLGKIIIANGGTVNVKSGVMLNMVNQARLVVLPGGTLTGEGSIEVNNGNAEGLENYNGGVVSIKVFNNNFGKFYNYGNFIVEEYQAGAQESNFYNHSLAVITKTGMNSETPNARIYNVCQFYVKDSMRARVYEGVMGSALIVNGTLFLSSSEDATATPTYVGLAAGALVQCGYLYNNGTSWSGPTNGGYAVLDIENEITFLNWEQDAPQNGGYFANNLYVYAGTWANVPDGNGYHQTDPSDAYNHSLSIAEYKFKNIVANCVGNGNVTIVEKGTYEVIPADASFVKGQAGCTPGYKIKKEEIIPGDPNKRSIRIMAEDLSVEQASDFDFNDVVFDVEAEFPENTSAVTQVKVTLWAAGGTLPLRLNQDDNLEVHGLLGVSVPTMTNTHAQGRADNKQWFAADDMKDKMPWSGTVTLANNASISKDNFEADVNNNLFVEVFKTTSSGGSWFVLTAKRGAPACKIGCPVGTPWAKERINMNNVFTEFKNWVTNDSPANWYDSKVVKNIYNGGNSVIYGKFD